jgi:hypothetical protein
MGPIERLAETGTRRVGTLVLGTDRERALRDVGRQALRQTAEQLLPADPERLVLVVGEVFSTSLPHPSADQSTVLEAVFEGIQVRCLEVDGGTDRAGDMSGSESRCCRRLSRAAQVSQGLEESDVIRSELCAPDVLDG